MSLLHITDSNFKKEVLGSDLPVLVDFWAPWCTPCKMIAPIIEELAKEYRGKLKIGKLNVEENPKAPSNFGIMSIPTLVFFKKGKIAEQVTSTLNKTQLKAKIEENI